MRPSCVALGRVLIWVMSPDWVEELCQLGFFIPKFRSVFILPFKMKNHGKKNEEDDDEK